MLRGDQAAADRLYGAGFSRDVADDVDKVRAAVEPFRNSGVWTGEHEDFEHGWSLLMALLSEKRGVPVVVLEVSVTSPDAYNDPVSVYNHTAAPAVVQQQYLGTVSQSAAGRPHDRSRLNIS